jgi:hypothetical protein
VGVFKLNTMETATQKLKRISQDLHQKYQEDITLKWLIDNIDDFIKEEKEQIKLAFETGNILGLQSIERSGEWFYNEKIK